MISLISRKSALGVLLFGSAFLTVACQKVPLLAPSGSTITLTALATALPINGSTDIIAQVIEPSGTPPHSGTFITFTTNLGTVQPSEAETDIAGRVTVKYVASSASGTATISAISGGVSASAANALKILVGTAAVGSVRVSASPTTLPALGGSSTIAAVVIDINGNPLPSATVSFSTTTGSLDQVSGTTDHNGVATAILKASTSATVTAAVGAQAGSSTGTPPTTGGTTTPPATGTASGTVTVTVAAAPGLVITPPSSAVSAGLPSPFTFAVTVPANGSAIRNVTVNWGDGASQDLGTISTAIVSHVFRSAGSYAISASVTDTFGSVVTVATSVTVVPVPSPTVIITPSTPVPGHPVDVTFQVQVTAPVGVGITDAQINYGEPGAQNNDLGGLSGNVTLKHTYNVPGTWTVTVSVTDTLNRTTNGTTTVTIS